MTVTTIDPVLDVRGVSKHYRGVKAIDDVSFSLGAGEVLGLIGPNGAGKTTLLNLITGYVRPDTGRVALAGGDQRRRGAAQLARQGMTRTFQAPYLFDDVSVVENVRRAAYARRGQSLLAQGLSRRSGGALFHRMTEQARDALATVGMGESLHDLPASSLPYGHRKLLSLAMVLATEPRVVCLDEPAAGLTRQEKDNIVRLVAEMQHRGMSVVLVEHDMGVVTAACQRSLVLNYGHCIAEGETTAVLSDPAVARAYLGATADA
jgi:ABC-type branched-subunit amino acid transport system ATPase component